MFPHTVILTSSQNLAQEGQQIVHEGPQTGQVGQTNHLATTCLTLSYHLVQMMQLPPSNDTNHLQHHLHRTTNLLACRHDQAQQSSIYNTAIVPHIYFKLMMLPLLLPPSPDQTTTKHCLIHHCMGNDTPTIQLRTLRLAPDGGQIIVRRPAINWQTLLWPLAHYNKTCKLRHYFQLVETFQVVST